MIRKARAVSFSPRRFSAMSSNLPFKPSSNMSPTVSVELLMANDEKNLCKVRKDSIQQWSPKTAFADCGWPITRFPLGEFYRATRSEIWNPEIWLVCKKIRHEKVGLLSTFYQFAQTNFPSGKRTYENQASAIALLWNTSSARRKHLISRAWFHT